MASRSIETALAGATSRAVSWGESPRWGTTQQARGGEVRGRRGRRLVSPLHQRRLMAKTLVLLVDDDTDLLDVLATVLSSDHHVRVAIGVPQAIALLAHGPLPDVVITDFNLPPHSADELLELIAARYPQVRRILHTSTSRDDFGAALPLADRVLAKGCDIDELQQAVRECLAASSPR
jgi:CheY-like chemotaxis protein